MLWDSMGQTLVSLILLLVVLPLGVLKVVSEIVACYLQQTGPLSRILFSLREWLFGPP